MLVSVVYEGKTFQLNLECSDTIDKLRQQLQDKAQIPRTHQRVMFNGKWLRQISKTLEAFDIREGSVLEVTVVDTTKKTAKAALLQNQLVIEQDILVVCCDFLTFRYQTTHRWKYDSRTIVMVLQNDFHCFCSLLFSLPFSVLL